jgi:hypothetical protein
MEKEGVRARHAVKGPRDTSLHVLATAQDCYVLVCKWL